MWHMTTSAGGPGGSPESRSATSKRQRPPTPLEVARSRARLSATAEMSTPRTSSPRAASQTEVWPRPHASSSAFPLVGKSSTKGANRAGSPSISSPASTSSARYLASHHSRSVSVTHPLCPLPAPPQRTVPRPQTEEEPRSQRYPLPSRLASRRADRPVARRDHALEDGNELVGPGQQRGVVAGKLHRLRTEPGAGRSARPRG